MKSQLLLTIISALCIYTTYCQVTSSRDMSHLPCEASQLNFIQEVMQGLLSRIENLENEIREIKQAKQESQVGFSAYMNEEPFHVYPDKGDTIPFSGVILNHGNHYDNTTSTFTCPQNGTYFFTYMLFSERIRAANYGRTQGTLMRSDGVELAETLCYNSNEANIWVQCGNSVLTECYQGQQVWVMSEWSGDNQMAGAVNQKASTFTGVLLYHQ